MNPIEKPIKKITKPILEILRKGFNKTHSKENGKYFEGYKEKNISNNDIGYKS